MRRFMEFAAVVMVISLGAFPALASATFTASSYPATFSGVTWGQDFILDGSSVDCKLEVEGAYSELSPNVTVTPSYTECKAFGYTSATVSMNGCDYVFYSMGSWDIVCPFPNSILIAAGNCEATIGGQSSLYPLWSENASGGLWLGPETNNLAFKVIKDGFLCPFSGTGSRFGKYQSVTYMFVSDTGNWLSVD